MILAPINTTCSTSSAITTSKSQKNRPGQQPTPRPHNSLRSSTTTFLNQLPTDLISTPNSSLIPTSIPAPTPQHRLQLQLLHRRVNLHPFHFHFHFNFQPQLRSNLLETSPTHLPLEYHDPLSNHPDPKYGGSRYYPGSPIYYLTLLSVAGI